TYIHTYIYIMIQQQLQQQQQQQFTKSSNQYVDFHSVVGKLTSDFEQRIDEWRKWTFLSYCSWYSLIYFIQMTILSLILSSSTLS
ncbi:hypothetical protein SAMD00019534_095610, partial [Acytostelium subglobosum LB1]|uniref:hypothetical protein n=1 Tax=Acytostelium subglobosum LB1 TaxID=1410327 RepID=UPI0006448E8B